MPDHIYSQFLDQGPLVATDRPSRLKLRWQDADSLLTAIHSQERVAGLTHNFYQYPARFSPCLAREAIRVFSDPGDLVVDPFVGGGTTLVESRASSRRSVGVDISSLAHFVSQTKSRPVAARDIADLRAWFEGLVPRLTVRQKVHLPDSDSTYLRNLDCTDTWVVRKLLQVALSEVQSIPPSSKHDLARCVVLRLGQWALDGRKRFPTAAELRKQLKRLSTAMLDAADEYARVVRKADRAAPTTGRRRTMCLRDSAQNVGAIIERTNSGAPRLIVTSPPYPGVHVLYHRWQVRGGKETPAPFWISNRPDGAGESYYLMHARRSGLRRYLAGIKAAFSSVGSVADRDAIVFQVLSFSDPVSQLPRYLSAMTSSGFEELLLAEHIDSADGRIWRDVPGRRWHANKKGDLASAREVVLLHRRR